jgi:hypothetical protein
MDSCASQPILVPLSEVTIEERRVSVSDREIALEATIDGTVAVTASARPSRMDSWNLTVCRSCCTRELTLQPLGMWPELGPEEVLDYLRMFVKNFARRRH